MVKFNVIAQILNFKFICLGVIMIIYYYQHCFYTTARLQVPCYY